MRCLQTQRHLYMLSACVIISYWCVSLCYCVCNVNIRKLSMTTLGWYVDTAALHPIIVINVSTFKRVSWLLVNVCGCTYVKLLIWPVNFLTTRWFHFKVFQLIVFTLNSQQCVKKLYYFMGRWWNPVRNS